MVVGCLWVAGEKDERSSKGQAGSGPDLGPRKWCDRHTVFRGSQSARLMRTTMALHALHGLSRAHALLCAQAWQRWRCSYFLMCVIRSARSAHSSRAKLESSRTV